MPRWYSKLHAGVERDDHQHDVGGCRAAVRHRREELVPRRDDGRRLAQAGVDMKGRHLLHRPQPGASHRLVAAQAARRLWGGAGACLLPCTRCVLLSLQKLNCLIGAVSCEALGELRRHAAWSTRKSTPSSSVRRRPSIATPRVTLRPCSNLTESHIRILPTQGVAPTHSMPLSASLLSASSFRYDMRHQSVDSTTFALHTTTIRLSCSSRKSRNIRFPLLEVQM